MYIVLIALYFIGKSQETFICSADFRKYLVYVRHRINKKVSCVSLFYNFVCHKS